jgi:hypothetical protein
MPDTYIQLEDANKSGELIAINLGGTNAENAVATIADITAATIDKADIDYVDNPAQLDFVAQNPIPLYKKGRVFYNGIADSLSYFLSIPGIDVNIGQQVITKVFNLSGATIQAGQVCRFDGFYSTSGVLLVVPALANTYQTAQVCGIATQAISNNTFGFITNKGVAQNIDTRGFTAGQNVFLSESTPGAMVTTAPSLATKIGQIMKVDIAGAVFVDIQNVITVPNVIAVMKEKVDSLTLTTTFQDLTNYSDGEAVRMIYNLAAGTITIPAAGWYRVTFSISFNLTTNTATRIVNAKILATASGKSYSFAISIPRDQGSSSGAFNVPFSANAGEVFKIQLSSAPGLTINSFTGLSFDVEAIRYT